MLKPQLLALPLVLLLAACPPPPHSNPQDVSKEQERLADAMKDYTPPTKSVPPFASSEGTVDISMNKLASVAQLQGWTFDGSLGRRGIAIISQPGHGRPMLVGIIFFYREGMVATLDMTACGPDDTAACQKMRDALLTVISENF